MTQKSINPLSRLCLHTITNKPWNIEILIEKYLLSGIQGISVWRDALNDKDLKEIQGLLINSGLDVVSLVRGGFFTGLRQEDREQAIMENKKAIEEAAAIGADMLVLVCGSTPGQPLETSRSQIKEAIESLIPFTEEHGIRLALEPLHPMYADSRSAINTLAQANALAEYFNSEWLGIALDIYHLWWDEDLVTEVERCGYNNNLFAVHLCDWRMPTRDLLNDRELMGRGIIDIQSFISSVARTGFKGFFEVEIFSDEYWSMDQDEFLKDIIESYLMYKF